MVTKDEISSLLSALFTHADRMFPDMGFSRHPSGRWVSPRKYHGAIAHKPNKEKTYIAKTDRGDYVIKEQGEDGLKLFDYYMDDRGLNRHTDFLKALEMLRADLGILPWSASNGSTPTRYQPREEKPQAFVPWSVFRALRLKDDYLFLYLSQYFNNTRLGVVWTEYEVRTKPGWGGLRTVFPYINEKGKIEDGSIVLYDRHTGHSMKGEKGAFSSLAKELGCKMEYVRRSCLFGAHLIPKYPTKVVGIVESEKTALICAVSAPSLLWLATGGKSKLTPGRLAPLKGRKILIFPDIDGVEAWEQKAEELKKIGFDIRCESSIKEYQPLIGDHGDEADLLLFEKERKLREEERYMGIRDEEEYQKLLRK